MKLADVVGNKMIMQTLQNAMVTGKLSHGYLFHGPAGVGKKTAALALAQTFLCLEPVAGASCGECLACKKIGSGNHPDVHLYQPMGSSVKIEQVREMQKTIYLKPYEGKGKVYIIDDTDKMTVEAANSLLKSLEEPPEDTLIILIATNIYAMLPTILSRCQTMHFKKVGQGDIEKWLVEYKGITPEKARFIGAIADGSLGKASQWAESNEIKNLRDEVVRVGVSLKHKSLNELFKMSEEWEKRKDEVTGLIDFLGIWYRDLLIWKTAKQQDLLVNLDCLEEIQKESNSWEAGDLVIILETLEETRKAIRSNGNLKLIIDQLFLTLQEPKSHGLLRRTS